MSSTLYQKRAKKNRGFFYRFGGKSCAARPGRERAEAIRRAQLQTANDAAARRPADVCRRNGAPADCFRPAAGRDGQVNHPPCAARPGRERAEAIRRAQLQTANDAAARRPADVCRRNGAPADRFRPAAGRGGQVNHPPCAARPVRERAEAIDGRSRRRQTTRRRTSRGSARTPPALEKAGQSRFRRLSAAAKWRRMRAPSQSIR